MKEAAQVRKPAPDIAITHVDSRAEIIRALDAKHPERLHAFVRGDINPDALKMKSQVVVKGDKGDPIMHTGDIVVSTDRAAFEENFARQSDASRSQVESVVEPERSTVYASPKKPRD